MLSVLLWRTADWPISLQQNQFVTVEQLIQKYKDGGELDSEDPALVMLKQWPASKQHKDNPEKLLGLEQKVYMNHLKIIYQ